MKNGEMGSEIKRLLKIPPGKSHFLFGPRGTGKSTWLRQNYPKSPVVDLLDAETFNRLIARPQDLMHLIPKEKLSASATIVIDEVQKIPALLDEVHRLIEKERRTFILTGSSARKLRKQGVNLLAGRALTQSMFPFTAQELGPKFKLSECLELGTLPGRFAENDPQAFLESYVATYLREEVQQEGLTRNLGAFKRFLETASFSQAQPLVVTNVAHDAQVERKTVEEYFGILEDLMIGVSLPVFSKRAKRDLLKKSKFFFFDAGVFQTLRPKGPLDVPHESAGPALETLIFNEIRALNSYFHLGYDLFFWRTAKKEEVDFVLYGKRGLLAIEAKLANRVRKEDLEALKLFREDYPMARCMLLYTGSRILHERGIDILPVTHFFENTFKILAGE